MITSKGLFDWATQEPGPHDRPAAYPYNDQQTSMKAVFHHSMEGYRGSYSALTDPARFPTAWHGTVAKDGTLYQHYDVRLALQASNAGNFTGPAFELEGVASEPINDAQLASYQRIHTDVARLTGRTPRRVLGQYVYEHLQRIPAGELWLLEHRQVGPTACPSERYRPLWEALDTEEENMGLAEDLATVLLDGFRLTVTAGNLAAARQVLGMEVTVGQTFTLTADTGMAFAKAQGMRFWEGLRLTQERVGALEGKHA